MESKDDSHDQLPHLLSFLSEFDVLALSDVDTLFHTEPLLGGFDVLPRELLPHVVRFLTGFDLLRLSHVDKRFHTDVLSANSVFWTVHAPRAMRVGPFKWCELDAFGWDRVRATRPRFPRRQGATTSSAQSKHEEAARARELLGHAKRRYFASVSLQFPGLQDASTFGPNDSAHVALQRHDLDIQETWASASFSFDVWFALLPPSASTRGVVGGVLFSAQGSNGRGTDTPSTVAHFVHIDPHGALYCSVARGDKRAVATLSLSRWYHLALTFDRSSENNAVQSVYLDGECIDTRHGVALPINWTQHQTFLIGTGFVDEVVSRGGVQSLDNSGFRAFFDAVQHWPCARLLFCGYYGFHGLLDDFRLWRGVLTPDDIHELSHGRVDHVLGRAACDWSLMTNGDYEIFHGDLWAVQCTRPTERICVEVHPSFRVWSVDHMPR